MLEKINLDFVNALKSGDKPKADALRLLKSALTNARIAAGHDLTDEEIVKVARKEIKSRIEARDLFSANDRPQQAEKEEYERSIYAEYVPSELSEQEVNKIIKTQADEKADISFSELMPKVMKEVAGRADGKLVAESVKKYLQG